LYFWRLFPEMREYKYILLSLILYGLSPLFGKYSLHARKIKLNLLVLKKNLNAQNQNTSQRIVKCFFTDFSKTSILSNFFFICYPNLTNKIVAVQLRIKTFTKFV